MVYKSIYYKLCKDLIVNIICDGQQMSLVWDVEGKLNRAPLMCAPRFFKTLDEAMEHIANNPNIAQGYHGFTVFEETCLGRYNSVSALEAYEVELLEQHNNVCPLCGREL